MTNDRALLILIPGFPDDPSDSTCLPAQQQFVKNINLHYPGTKVLILAFQYPFREAVYDWNGNTVIAFGGKNKGGLSRLLLWRRVIKTMDGLNKTCKIAGVLSFWAGECALVGKQWSIKQRKPFYCWMMGQDARKENKYIRRSRLRGNQLVCISDFTARELREHHGIDAAQVIPLGVDPPLPVSQKKDIAIFCAGSLIPLKQYHVCIEVMQEVLKQFPAAGMMIAGKGPEEEKLRSLIREKHLQNNILLIGEKNHAEVLELMGRSRIFLHASSYEGFGMACLEALAAGSTVISFHQPMNNGIENWHVVKTPAEMTEKVIGLLREPVTTRPVIPYKMEDTVSRIMTLFGL